MAVQDRRRNATQTSVRVADFTSLFTGLDRAAAASVMAHLDEEAYPAGSVIFEDEAPGNTLYIVKSGRVQVSKILGLGQEHVLAELGPGEFFGEMALLEEKPRSARVSATVATTLLTMSRQAFTELIAHQPVIAANFLRVISARLRQRNQHLEVLVQEKQALVEELAAKNVELERALSDLRAALTTVAEHERVKRDLEIARQIQQQMLLATFPQLPGLQLHATTVPSRWVGGDLYDMVYLDEHRVGLLLGDVSGKGIPAAMQMTRLMGEFRACVSHAPEPEKVVQTLNELLCQRNVQWTSFVTVQYLVLDLARQHLQFICAGHPPILLCHADQRVEQLGTLPNLPLGIDSAFAYRHEECELASGDRLLLYSDGAYELQNDHGEMFGLPRLVALFAAAPAAPAATIGAIQGELSGFGAGQGMRDDTTLLCARMTAG